MLPDTVTRGLRLTRHFDGADSRAQFWPYAGVVTAGVLGVGSLLQFGILASSFVTSLDPAGPAVSVSFLVSTVVGALVYVILLAAAVVRRLHDRGHRGWWALAPLALLLTAIGLMAPMFVSPDEPPDPTGFVTAFAINVLYFVALGLLVVQLALPGRSAELSDRSEPG